MEKSTNISEIYSYEGMFFQNILHFLLSTHTIPLIEYSLRYLPSEAEMIVSLKTTSGKILSTKLNELPNPSDKDFLQLSARILINGCYEALKENPLKNKVSSEVLEFFRHIRNASSHNGIFVFKKNEPIKKAKWTTLEITKKLNGTPLFNFFAIGDVLILLGDIAKEIES